MTHEAADDLRLPVEPDSSDGEDVTAYQPEAALLPEEEPLTDAAESAEAEAYETQDALLQPEPEAPIHKQVTPEPAPTQENFLAFIWGKVFPSKEAQREHTKQRLLELDATIRDHPQAASNYVVRGEIYLDLGHYDLALIDFQNALEIVIYEVENNRWGVVAQVMQDRALRGLNQAKRHLPEQDSV